MWWLSPLSWLLLAMLGAFAAGHLRRGRRIALAACASLALLATVAMTPLAANLLLGGL